MVYCVDLVHLPLSSNLSSPLHMIVEQRWVTLCIASKLAGPDSSAAHCVQQTHLHTTTRIFHGINWLQFERFELYSMASTILGFIWGGTSCQLNLQYKALKLYVHNMSIIICTVTFFVNGSSRGLDELCSRIICSIMLECMYTFAEP